MSTPDSVDGRRRYAVIMDTGAGSRFIGKEVLPERQWSRIRPIRSNIRIRDAGNHRVNITGIVELYVELGSQIATLKVYVDEKLGIDVILGCDFCDKYDEAIDEG